MTAPVISKSVAAPNAKARIRPADLSVGIRGTFPLPRGTKLLPSSGLSPRYYPYKSAAARNVRACRPVVSPRCRAPPAPGPGTPARPARRGRRCGRRIRSAAGAMYRPPSLVATASSSAGSSLAAALPSISTNENGGTGSSTEIITRPSRRTFAGYGIRARGEDHLKVARRAGQLEPHRLHVRAPVGPHRRDVRGAGPCHQEVPALLGRHGGHDPSPLGRRGPGWPRLAQPPRSPPAGEPGRAGPRSGPARSG